MNRKRFVMATIATILLVTPSAVAADGNCSIAGTWLTGAADPPGLEPLLFTETLVPLDPAGAEMSYRGSTPNGLTWSPFAPNTDVGEDSIGTFLRTGPRTYEFTIMGHGAEAPPKGVPARGQIQQFWIWSGTAECVDENTMVKKGTWALFSAIDVPAMGIHDQDKNNDGFPDAGEVPIVSVPLEAVSKRVQVRKPYPVTP